jgi:hypothetical protein
MTLRDASRLADTFGWDTVFGIRYADVNAAIAASGATPPAFSGSLADGNSSVNVDGTFAAWEIALGGDGQDLHLKLPMPIVNYDDGTGKQTFDSAVAIAELQLSALPRPGQFVDGTWVDLKVLASGDQPASVLKVTFTGSNQPSDGMVAALVQAVLEDWLTSNLQSFNHVFASVNLNARAAVGGLQWLMPTDVSYAVVDRGSLETSVFAVLCMTEGRTSSELGHQVSPFVIPDGHRAGLLMSPERFLSKLLLPGIGTMFSGPVTPRAGKAWPQDYFGVDGDEHTIVNLADIKMDKFELDGVTYVADLKKGNLQVRLQTTFLETQFIDFHHQLDLKVYKLPALPIAWVDVYHNINSRSTAGLTGQTFDLLPDGGTHHAVVTQTSTAQKIQLGLIIASAAASLVGMTAFFAVKGIGTVAEPAIDTAAATVDVTATVADVPTAAESTQLAADGAPVALSSLRAGAVQASKFLVAWNVAGRASILSALTGIPAALDGMLVALSDIHSHDMPAFQDFVAHMMTPVQWPAHHSQFTVEKVAFNGAYQIAGNPGFAG